MVSFLALHDLSCALHHIAHACPDLLALHPEEDLDPTVEYLSSELKLSKASVVAALQQAPHLLFPTARARMIKRIAFLSGCVSLKELPRQYLASIERSLWHAPHMPLLQAVLAMPEHYRLFVCMPIAQVLGPVANTQWMLAKLEHV
jgi:hypothetical protein